ncbi:protein kinase domain-containing protein [Streptomyces lonarensis]|uniref:non-specific serine/threonine protein kinase n=2 Tax=Streptomyces lonarensis TaxID=700599 RepID=A0A7X6I061_9ACTN|nr:protein kinase [Streptomyces lonarensis]NJQ07301.1 protein kinase [Streptomyces lonarensis]
MDALVLDGRYRIGERLGEGGMGAVWEAVDLRLERHVAVKVMSGVSVRRDPRAKERFDREAKLLAGLASPYVVTVHDAGEATVEDSKLLYLVMERLHGRSLADVIEHALPSLDEVARWAEQICRALSVAHDADVVHRDLKPANVMVCADGLVRVLDFGIAAVLSESADHARLTSTGVVVGTPAYMAPEQIESGSYDARSDLYSLGCMLYELVVGRPPFNSSALYALMRDHVTATPELPSALRPGVPEEWDALILQLLAKSAEDRPVDAAEVARTLRQLPRPAVEDTPDFVPAALDDEAPPGYVPTRVDPRMAMVAPTVPEVPPPPFEPPMPAEPPMPPGPPWLSPGQRCGPYPDTERLMVALGWSLAPETDEAPEVDGSAFAVDADGQVLSDQHFVFYNNVALPSDHDEQGDSIRLENPSVEEGEDGEDGPADATPLHGDGDGEQRFLVEPGRLDADTDRIVFALSLHEAEERGLNMSSLADMTVRVLDADSGAELCGFRLENDAVGDGYGLSLGELYRTPQGWGFHADCAAHPSGLVQIAQVYGVNV